MQDAQMGSKGDDDGRPVSTRSPHPGPDNTVVEPVTSGDPRSHDDSGADSKGKLSQDPTHGPRSGHDDSDADTLRTAPSTSTPRWSIVLRQGCRHIRQVEGTTPTHRMTGVKRERRPTHRRQALGREYPAGRSPQTKKKPMERRAAAADRAAARKAEADRRAEKDAEDALE